MELFGGSPSDAARRAPLGMTLQETGLPATLRVGEVLAFVARHHPDPVPAGELLAQFGLDGLERWQTRRVVLSITCSERHQHQPGAANPA